MPATNVFVIFFLMLKFQFQFRFPLLFFFIFFFVSFGTVQELLFLVGWEKSETHFELGQKSLLAPFLFMQSACLSLFLIWSYRTTFSEELTASFLSTPSLGQIFRAASCSSHCCVYRQMFNKALKLLSSFENLDTYFCVGFRNKNWVLVLCGWALLLFLTLQDMSESSGGAHIRTASCWRGLEVWTVWPGMEVGLGGH